MAAIASLGGPCLFHQLLGRKLVYGDRGQQLAEGWITRVSSVYSCSSNLRAPTSISAGRTCEKVTNRNRRRTLVAKAAESTGNSSATAQTNLDNNGRIQQVLKELEDAFLALEVDFLKSLPSDLQVDLKDAAFDCSNKAASESSASCEAAMVRLGAALEARDSKAAARALASLAAALLDEEPQGSSVRAAVGKRLKSVGRRFGSMGTYGKGEVKQLSRAFDAAGSAVGKGSVEGGALPGSMKKEAAKVFKFGDLQVAVTRTKALTGAAIAALFGVISGNLSASIQNVTQDSMQYANDSALAPALSLRGTLLAMGYSCTVLSVFAAVGLVALSLQLSPEDSKE